MTYGLKYKAGWGAKSGIQGYLYIDLEGYSGAVTDLKIRHGGSDDLKVEQNFSDWDSPILGRTLSFTIVNDFTDFYELLPLLTATERQYQVRLVIIAPSISVRTLFQGFLNVDMISQKYLHKNDITFVASSYLSKLDHFTNSMVDTVQNVYFINLIDAILREIGTFNIRVNCSLYANPWYLDPGQTLFNVNGISTEMFWKDNTERSSNLDILTKILTSFTAYIYWEDGYWYIERYADIWNENPSFVEYTTGQTYNNTTNPTGTVVALTRTLEDVHSLVFTGQTQTLYIDPGYKRITIDAEGGYLLLNLAPSDIDIDLVVPFVYTGTLPIPPNRTWWKDTTFTWENGSFGDIGNCIKKTTAPNPSTTSHFYRGLYARFKIAISANTSLGLAWKYGLQQTANTINWEHLTVTMHWFLGSASSFAPNQGKFLIYDPATSSYSWQLANYTECFNSKEIKGTSFDPVNRTVEISENIPAGLISGMGGDLVFGLCIPKIEYDLATNFFSAEYFGDIALTINNTLEPNEIEGEISSLFLNKKDLKLDLVDIANINYTNGVLQSSPAEDLLDSRTAAWTDPLISLPYSIIEWVFINKFKLYNVSRQRINGEIKRSTELKLFSLFEDSGQADKKFLLVGYTYYPTEDLYDVKLNEYDSDTEITIA